jgi:hypothetical protein
MPRIDDGRIRTDDVEVDWGDGEVVGAEAAGEAPSSFAALLLRAEIVQGLEKEGYLRPSPIQVEIMALPQELRDLITLLCSAVINCIRRAEPDDDAGCSQKSEKMSAVFASL